MQLDVAHQFLPKQHSVRASQVMDHFGVDFEQGRHIIADGIELPIEPGMVVLFTGASGSGKSSLLREAARSLEQGAESTEMGGQGSFRAAGIDDVDSSSGSAGASPSRCAVQSLDELVLPDKILIEAIDSPLADAMGLLSACGLGEAQLMLRTPSELSDGQRYRFRLALALSQRPQWVVADEFTATLDRTLAKVIAFNIRRQCERTGTGFLLATTHEDVAADLDPDLYVQCRLDGEIAVKARSAAFPGRMMERHREGEAPAEPNLRTTVNSCSGSAGASPSPVKKKRSRSPTSCGSAWRPVATGRTSRGGIIAAITSDS